MITTKISDLALTHAMNIRAAANLPLMEQRFYFGNAVETDSVGIVLSCKSNKQAPFPNFYKQLRKLAQGLNKQIYFLRVGSYIAKQSQLRTKLGLRKEITTVHRDSIETIEVADGAGNSRLGIFGPLNEEIGFGDLDSLLNWMYSVILISDRPQRELGELVKQWISVASGEMLGFNFARVAADVQRENLILARFFPSENGRSAAMAFLYSSSK